MLNRKINPQYPSKDVSWTDDFKVELPIKRSSEGVGSLYPQTLIDSFRKAIKLYKDLPALSVKRGGHWVHLYLIQQTITFSQYYEQCMNFAASLIAFGFP